MKVNKGRLPKSTTCCWTLRQNHPFFEHYQYFVGPELFFALNLSSLVFGNNINVGATFMSSMFEHCTTIPIWIDINGLYHLKGPRNMYNFAWGATGGSKEDVVTIK